VIFFFCNNYFGSNSYWLYFKCGTNKDHAIFDKMIYIAMRSLKLFTWNFHPQRWGATQLEHFQAVNRIFASPYEKNWLTFPYLIFNISNSNDMLDRFITFYLLFNNAMKNFVRPLFERSSQGRDFFFWITEGIGLTGVRFHFWPQK
jgi:hypothetical protein